MKSALRRVVAWVLIFVMILPNFTFAATLDNGTVTLNFLLPSEESASSLENLELELTDTVNPESIYRVDVTGLSSITLDTSNTTTIPDGTYSIALNASGYDASDAVVVELGSGQTGFTADLTLKAAEEPVGGEPAAEEPVGGEPAAEEPVGGEPAAEEPVGGEPVTKEPVGGEPVTEEPVGGEPVTEEPVGGEAETEKQIVQTAAIVTEEVIPEGAIAAFEIFDSTGTEYSSYRISRHTLSGGPYDDEFSEGIYYIKGSSAVGEYLIMAAAKTGTDSFSPTQAFSVVQSGESVIAKIGETILDPATPYPIHIQKGIEAGKVLDTSNNVLPNLELRFFLEENDNRTWLANAEPRADGTFYLPANNDGGIDGNYHVEADVYSFEVINWQDNYIISGGNLTPKNLIMPDCNIYGYIKDYNGLDLADVEYNVEVSDANENTYNVGHYNSNNKEYFKVGNLTQGDYTLKLVPRGSDADAYASSLPVTVIVGASPVQQDLQFRNISDVPMSLHFNNAEVVSSKDDYVYFDVVLEGVSSKTASDYTIQVKDGETVLTPSSFDWREAFEDNGHIRLKGKFALEPKLGNGNYKLLITHNSDSIEVDFELTDEMILDGATNFGKNGSDYYSRLNLANSTSDPVTVKLFDSSNGSLGTVTSFKIDDNSHEHMIKYTADNVDHIAIDGVRLQAEGRDRIDTSGWVHDIIIQVSSADNGNHIKLYNGLLLVDDLKSFKIKNHLGQDEVIGDSTYTVQSHSDHCGGIDIFVPFDDTKESGDYEFYIQLEQVTSDGSHNWSTNRGNYYINYNAPLYVFTAADSLGNPITEFDTTLSNQSPGADVQFKVEGSSIMISDQTTDGNYAVGITPMTGTESISQMFKFNVAGDVVTEITDSGNISLPAGKKILAREGLFIGNAVTTINNTDEKAYINLHLKSGEHFDWIGNMDVRSDKKIYLPKVEGVYEVKLEAYDKATSFRDLKEYTIDSSLTITPIDLQLQALNLTGVLRDPGGNALEGDNLRVELKDSNGDSHPVDTHHMYDENLHKDFVHYYAGGLEAGLYNVTLIPGDDYVSQGYATSETVNVTIGQDLKEQDLQFRNASELPLEIKDNYVKVMPSNNDYFKFELMLAGVSNTNISNYKITLIDKSGVADDYVATAYHWSDIHNDNGLLRFKGEIKLDGHMVEVGNYTLKLEHDGEMDSVDVTVTDSPVLEGSFYIGSETVTEDNTDVTYHYFNLHVRDYKYGTIEVFDKDNGKIGSGDTLEFNEFDQSYKLMKIKYDGDPSYVKISGYMYMQDNADDINLGNTHEPIITVEQTSTGNVVYMYNENMDPNDISKFEVRHIDSSDYVDVTSKVTITKETDKFVDYIKVVIPFDENLSDGKYKLQWTTSSSVWGHGHFWLSFKAPLYVFNVADASGAPITDYDVAISHQSDGADLRWTRSGSSIMISSDSNDGDYAIAIAPMTGEESISEMFKFNITGSTVTERTDSGNVSLDPNKELRANLGVYIGQALGLDGETADRAYVNLHVKTDNGYDWIGNMEVRDDGKIYLPKVAGEYEVKLQSYDLESSFRDMKNYTVADDFSVTTSPLQLQVLNLMGILKDPNGNALDNGSLRVELRDGHGNSHDVDTHHMYDHDLNKDVLYYFAGGLEADTYTVTLIPYDYYTSKGYTTSATETVSLGSTLMTQDLQFRNVNDVPFALVKNYAKVLSSEDSRVYYDVVLEGVSSTNADDYTIKIKDGNNIIEPTDFEFKEAFNYNGPVRVKGKMMIDTKLGNGNYELLVTYNDDTLNVPFELTDELILDGSEYFGYAGGKHYTHIHLANADGNDIQVKLFDKDDQELGTVTATVLESRFRDYYMSYTYDNVDYMVIDGARLQSEDRNRVDTGDHIHDVLIKVETLDDGNHIKLYNSMLKVEYLKSFKIKDDKGQIEIIGDSNYEIKTHTDLSGGIEIKVPFDESKESGYYGFYFNIEQPLDNSDLHQYQTDRGDYYIAYAAPIFKINVTDSNNNPISNYYALTAYKTDGANIKLTRMEDLVTIYEDSNDGEYTTVMAPRTGDEIYSEKFEYKIENGVVLDLQGNQIQSPITVKTREALVVGTAHNPDGSSISQAFGSVHRIVEDEDDQWEGSIYFHDSNNIKLPVVDGKYKVSLKPYYGRHDVVVTHAEYEISGGQLVGDVTNIKMNTTQITGEILAPDGSSVEHGDYRVILKNSDDNEFEADSYEVDGKHYYRAGGLLAGDYEITLRADGAYHDLRYTGSEPITVAINDNKIEKDLKFRNAEDLKVLSITLVAEDNSSPYTGDVSPYIRWNPLKTEYIKVGNEVIFTHFDDGKYDLIIKRNDDSSDDIISTERIIVEVENGTVKVNGNATNEFTAIVKNRPLQLAVKALLPDGSTTGDLQVASIIKHANGESVDYFYPDGVEGFDSFYLLESGDYVMRLVPWQTSIYAMPDAIEFTINADGSSNLLEKKITKNIKNPNVTGLVKFADDSDISQHAFYIEASLSNGQGVSYFARTDAAGKYAFNLPEGTYSFKAYNTAYDLTTIDEYIVTKVADDIEDVELEVTNAIATFDIIKTHANDMVVDGFTTETKNAFVDARVAVNAANADTSNKEKVELLYELRDTIKALVMINPTLTPSHTELKNIDVDVTVNKGFTTNDSNYKTLQWVGEEWVEFEGNLTITKNTLLRVKTIYDNGVFESVSQEAELDITNIDKEKPLLTLIGDRQVEIRYNSVYTDAGKVVEEGIVPSVENTVDTSKLGDYIYKYTATDAAGNVSTQTRLVKVVDDVEPTISITDTSGNALSETENVIGTNVEFKVTGSDEYDQNPTIEVVANGSVVNLVDGKYVVPMLSGDNFILAKITDGSGNTAQSVLKVVNHEMVLTPSTRDLTNQSVDVTATVVGVDGEVYTNNAGQTSNVSTADENGDVTFVAKIDGLTTDSKVYTYSVDNIDKIAPDKPSIAADSMDLTNEGTFLQMTGTENLMYQVDSGDWTDYPGSIYLDSNATVNIKAVDDAGNETSGDPITVNWIDKEAPTVSSPPVIKVDGNIYNDNNYVVSGNVVTLEMTLTDNNDNLKVYTRFNDEDVVVADATKATPFTHTVTLPSVSSDTNTIKVWAYDEAGNRVDFGTSEFVKSFNLKIDVHAPVMIMNGGDATVMLKGVYQDPGVVAYDDLDTNLSVDVTDEVDLTSVGEYTIQYNVSDAAGNEATELIRNVSVVDTVKPMITTDLEDKTVNKSAFELNASAEDNDAVTSWTVTHDGQALTGTNDVYSVTLNVGENTLVLTGSDASNNVSTETYVVTFEQPDTDNPYMTQNITVPTNKTITVEVTYPDGASIKKYAVLDVAGLTDIDAITWSDYSDAIDLTANKVIYAYSQMDNDSLPSELVSLVVDNYDATAPDVPVLTPTTTEPTNQALGITVQGEGTIYYQIGQTFDKDAVELTKLAVYSSQITVDQNTTIYAIAVDEAGNRSDLAELVVSNIDTLPPVGEVVYSTKAATSSDVIATLIVKNGEAYEIANDGPRYHTFKANGSYTFNFSDLAGNTSSVTATVENIDKANPVINSKSVTVNGQAVDFVKGGDLVKVTYQVADAKEVSGTVDLGNLVVGTPFKVSNTNNVYTLEANLQVPSDFNGTVAVNAVIKDAANNKVNDVSQATLTIDNVDPVFNVRFNNTINNGYITDDVIDTVITNDGSSIFYGFSQANVNEDITNLDTALNNVEFKDGESHTVYFKGVDKAGNESDVTSLTFKWDPVEPAAPTVNFEDKDVTNLELFPISGFAEPGKVTIMRGEELLFDGATSDYIAGIDISLRPGDNVLTLKATDLAGNVTVTPLVTTLKLDVEAPVIDVTLRESDDKIVITSDEKVYNATYMLDGNAPVAINLEDMSEVLEAITDDGEHFLYISGEDEAGNTGVGRLSFVTVAAETSEQELSEGITMNSGSFSDSSQMVVRTFEVDAGTDMGFVGEAIDFELDEGVTVGANGVVVDVFVGLGYPENTKLNYYQESSGTWLPLDNSADDGDSYYNFNDGEKYVEFNINADVAGGEKIITVYDADDVGQTRTLVEAGHIVGILKHFSGYAAIEDTTPPELTVTVANEVEYTTADTYTVTATVSEAATITLYKADGSTEIESKVRNSAGSVTFDLPLADDEAENTFKFKAVDLASKESPVQTFSIKRDSSAPVYTKATITGSYKTGSVSKTKDDSDTLTVTDANLDISVIVAETYFKQVTINDVVFDSKDVDTSITLVEGSNNIKIVAEDLVGNEVTKDFTVVLDTTGPEVVITEISDGDVLGGKIFTGISGTDLDRYVATLTSTSVDETFTDVDVDFDVASGSKDDYTLTVDGYDEHDNVTRVSIDFTVDQSAPSITFGDVENNSNRTQSVEIKVTPEDADTEIKIYKNDVRVTSITPTDQLDADDNTIRVYSFDAEETGVYRVEVNAINGASASNKTLTFTIDKEAPTISVSGVEDGKTYASNPTITFSSSDSVTATLDGNEIASGYKVSTNGDYTLVVTARDAAGNETVETIDFTVNVVNNPDTGDDPDDNDSSDSGSGGYVPPSGNTKPTEPSEEAEVVEFTAESKELTFEETGIVFDMNKVEVPEGTEFSVEEIEIEAAPEPDDKRLQIAVVSKVYEFTASETFKGKIEISIPYDPEQVEKPNKLVASYYDEEKGKWVVLGGKVDTVNHKVIFKTNHFSKYAVMERSRTFDDLAKYGWAKNAVDTLASRGVISGYAGNVEFRPGNEITRAEFATMVVKSLNLFMEDSNKTFTDIQGKWYEEMILIAASNNIMSGYNNQAKPNDLITREQMAVMVMNAYQLVDEKNLATVNAAFDDSKDISSWATKSVANAHKQGIISGKGGNKFAPADNATRAEAAAMIYNLLKALDYIK